MGTPALARLMDRLRRNGRSHLGTLLIVLAVFTGAHLWQTRHLPTGAVPDIPLRLNNGETLMLSDWRARFPGQPVALHVWAEWCPVCRAEEHNISRLQTDWPVLAIAMQSGGPGQVQRVLDQRGLPWTSAIDESGATARQLGVHAVPALLVLDARGSLSAASVGYTSEIGMRLRLLWARLRGGFAAR